MRVLDIFKNRKLFLLNIFLFLYVIINLIGGERGLASYFEKINLKESLEIEKNILKSDIQDYDNKNKLLSDKIDLDYLDMLYREKLKLGKKNEILIKLQ